MVALLHCFYCATPRRDLQRNEMFVYSHDGQYFYAPRTLAQLVKVRSENPDVCIVAGSTDVGLWVTKQMLYLGNFISLGQVAELKSMREKDGGLDIGAGVTLNDAYDALCRHYPSALSEMRQRFAPLPIRNQNNSLLQQS